MNAKIQKLKVVFANMHVIWCKIYNQTLALTTRKRMRQKWIDLPSVLVGFIRKAETSGVSKRKVKVAIFAKEKLWCNMPPIAHQNEGI